MDVRKMIVLFVSGVVASSCTQSVDVGAVEEDLFFECGNGFRYPTSQADFERIYAGRVFFAPGGAGNHLGHDIAYAEGAAIYSIACGRIVHYAASSPTGGYGTLYVAIEHVLSRPIQVSNGYNEIVTITRFLSIYGHLRPTSGRNGEGMRTGLRAGDSITPTQVIGYVEHRDLNGDGNEHLHFGIRLQSDADARRTHPSAPYRGYDVAGNGRRYFADPAIFMRELLEAHPVLWHPPGSFIVHEHDPTEGYLVVGDGDIVRVNPTFRVLERLDRYAIPVSRAELDCFRHHEWTLPPYDGTTLTTRIVFDGDPAVYELRDVGNERYAFISWEAFLSWGWSDADIRRYPASERSTMLARYVDRGFRRMRPGSLVRARGTSEVAFVTGSERLPFFNWETFVAMGLEHQPIYEIESHVIDAVAYPRGGIITPELARLCRVPSCSGSRCDGAGTSGGGGDPPPDDASVPAPPPDAGVSPTSACSVDTDCPGYGSGWRCRSGSCLETDIDGDGYLGSDGDCNIDVARIHRDAVESCDYVDEDCDGRVDETFDLTSDPRNCGSCGRACGSGEVCTAGTCVRPCSASSEVCGDGIDNNCDGRVDEGCAPVCTPVAEVCDGRDQDCDGTVDEGIAPIACSTACGSGTRTCVGGSFGACSARVPSAETCNGLDDDCDGTVDEGVCAPACVPTSPSRDICDGRDNDCDGTVDNRCPAMSPYLVEIWMDPSVLDGCPDPGGFRINLWGPGGIILQNVVGEPFRRTINASWVAASAVTLSCSVAPTWHDWSGDVGEPSSLNGVLVMRLGGRDMLPTSLVCDDMVNPAWGAKPYLPLESRYEGSCTPRW